MRAENMRQWNSESSSTEEMRGEGMEVGGIQEHSNCITFFNSLTEIYLFTYHTFDPFKVYNSRAFSILQSYAPLS